MHALLTKRCGPVAGILSGALLLATANAQVAASIEKIAFDVTDAFEPGAAVSGVLRIPVSERDRLPAVLIVNSSPGFDGRGAFYAEALGEAGMATLEIDMMQGKGMPASPRQNLPHAYESLRYLARHPRIDGTRIGIMGFSWGGIVSVLASSDELARKYAGGKLRFAAHLGIYPICWRHHAVLAGKSGAWKDLKPIVYRRVTGSPVHILAGDKDGYDDPESCARFLAALPPQVRSRFSLTVYAGATFGWDSRFSSATYDAAAKRGKGGIVDVIADPEIANRSRGFAVTYFRNNLAAD
jgi:dienelactone hydrolase